jgi:hypothetical protein
MHAADPQAAADRLLAARSDSGAGRPAQEPCAWSMLGAQELLALRALAALGDRLRSRPRGREVSVDPRSAGSSVGARQPQGWRPPQGAAASALEDVPSRSAARIHAGRVGAAGGAGVGAVSRMKHSSAATTAAASSGEAAGATIRS